MSEYKASSALTPVGSKAVRELIDVGLIPRECTRFELLLDRREAIQATCTFFVSEEQLQKFADVMKSIPEEASQILRQGQAIVLPMNERMRKTAERIG